MRTRTGASVIVVRRERGARPEAGGYKSGLSERRRARTLVHAHPLLSSRPNPYPYLVYLCSPEGYELVVVHVVELCAPGIGEFPVRVVGVLTSLLAGFCSSMSSGVTSVPGAGASMSESTPYRVARRSCRGMCNAAEFCVSGY